MMEKLRSSSGAVAAGAMLLICSGVGIGDTLLFLRRARGLGPVSHAAGPTPPAAGVRRVGLPIPQRCRPGPNGLLERSAAGILLLPLPRTSL